MKTKHTPGPWHIATSGNIQDSNGVTVAIPYGPAGETITVEPIHKANARLISAAPDMLDALIALQKEGVTINATDKATTAIDKAVGNE